MFTEVISPKESLAALITHLRLESRVDDRVPRQVFVALEGLSTDRTAVGPVLAMTQLVSVQVFLALQPGTANVTDKTPLYLVGGQVRLQQILVRVCSMTLRTEVKARAISRRYYPNVPLSGLSSIMRCCCLHKVQELIRLGQNQVGIHTATITQNNTSLYIIY